MTPAEKLSKSMKRVSRASASSARAKLRPEALVCRVRELRMALGLTQDAVARALGRTNPWLCEIEAGRDVKMTSAFELAAFFGKTIPDLWPSLAQPKETT